MTKITLRAVGLLAVLLIVSEVNAQETRLKWWGHAAFSVTTPKGKVLLIDPWLSNPIMGIGGEIQIADGEAANGFAADVKKLRIGFYEMKPGETISFRG